MSSPMNNDNGIMRKGKSHRIAAFTRWCAILMGVAAIALFAQVVGRKTSPDVADTQPEEKDVTAPMKVPILLTAPGKLGVINNAHGIGVVSGTGTFSFFTGAKEVTGDVTADGNGGFIYNTVPNWTTTTEYLDGFRLWKAGAIFGITHNGHGIGVLSGTGKVYFSTGAKEVTGDVTGDGHGGFIYNNVTSATTTGEYLDEFRLWKAGAVFGITHNGHGIGVLRGTGKLDFSDSGANVTGDVTADGKGGFVYSNVTNSTTTSEYWDGVRKWKAGAIVGVKDSGKEIGVITGTGEVDYFGSGAHVTGDVTADGKGGFVYSNVANGTTTSEYWDGAKAWKAGAVLGITSKGIRVISGSGRLDYFGSGAHVIGDVAADGKGGFVYSNVKNGTTTSEFWDGAKMWKAGAILGVIDRGKGIGVISGTVKVD